ncbi:gluconate 2-dehydrogenase subunit 3 family protein [Gelidibacter salicanalis]|uniref:Gluconate 2-dehydrogenase subunit 3 family protein n=1 Tax=Gelidibacter salicanalis TaxID=291193 RepID=A0A5C7AKQ1_9FLAO|nr:gluconate 2-dehydrogenase subunit 3 family protein [Gelidibacter salicanalis]TXE08153.1 gluconate 2-dehydrogenase subunit 3 family protein [Gelidibacter salicanalis]
MMDRRTALKNMALSFGFAVSGTTIISVFNSCSDAKTTVISEFFKASEMYSISQLVDLLLPTTTTIGAKDLNIARFIDKMCQHVLNAEQQMEMKLGTEEFSKRFNNITGKVPVDGNVEDYQKMLTTYFHISEAQQDAVFELLDSDYQLLAHDLKPDYRLYTFLTTVRELSLLGFFTSQTIMELEA